MSRMYHDSERRSKVKLLDVLRHIRVKRATIDKNSSRLPDVVDLDGAGTRLQKYGLPVTRS
jgi:hypothetical protein